MNKNTSASKSLCLLSSILFGSKNYINGKEKQRDVDKNIINKNNEQTKFTKIGKFKTIVASCQNENERSNTLTPLTTNHKSTVYEIKEKEIKNVENNLKHNMDTFLKNEKTEVQDKSENEWGCSFENEETEKEEITSENLSNEMKKMIEDILNKYTVVLFMKGTALNPFCKYSKEAIHILKLNKVKEIHTVNILSDLELKNSLKIYSKWPTFPQLYVCGKFVGGIDKIKELHENNYLKQILEQQQEKDSTYVKSV